jgi:uncharacterized membrane protein
MKKEVCHISKAELPGEELVKGTSVRKQLRKLIQNDYPDFSEDKFISHDALNSYRKKYLEDLIQQEYGEVNQLETEVVKAIDSDELLSENIENQLREKLTLGQRVADRIAVFGGSWTFIISFFSFIVGWVGLNIFILASRPFDPYPFILLNLLLSCLAAIQAPIIMMSQNRQEQKDRQRSEHDYKINLKAELEIRLLHEKIDHLIVHQNKRLLEIQELQLDYLEELSMKKTNGESK